MEKNYTNTRAQRPNLRVPTASYYKTASLFFFTFSPSLLLLSIITPLCAFSSLSIKIFLHFLSNQTQIKLSFHSQETQFFDFFLCISLSCKNLRKRVLKISTFSWKCGLTTTTTRILRQGGSGHRRRHGGHNNHRRWWWCQCQRGKKGCLILIVNVIFFMLFIKFLLVILLMLEPNMFRY